MTIVEINKIKILLIDDSSVESFLTTNVLNEIDFIEKVEHYDQPNKALRHLIESTDESEWPDLILLDIMMPYLDGFEFLQELENSDRFDRGYPFKILLLTNSKSVRDREKYAREVGLVGFMEKPIIKEDFEREVMRFF